VGKEEGKSSLLSRMKLRYLTANPFQTRKLGEILAKEMLKTKPGKTAFIIGLEGDLGGGKTTFLQGFARGCGIKEKILSPTFIIMKEYELRRGGGGGSSMKKQRRRSSLFQKFYHIDCYRVEKPKELLDLGFKEIISNPQNIVAIEWADRLREILPENTLILKFEFINKSVRKIMLK